MIFETYANQIFFIQKVRVMSTIERDLAQEFEKRGFNIDTDIVRRSQSPDGQIILHAQMPTFDSPGSLDRYIEIQFKTLLDRENSKYTLEKITAQLVTWSGTKKLIGGETEFNVNNPGHGHKTVIQREVDENDRIERQRYQRANAILTRITAGLSAGIVRTQQRTYLQ